MRSLAASLAVLLLGACASQIQLPKEIRIPVPVPCLDALPPEPMVSTDEQLLAMGDFELVLVLAADRKALEVSYVELRAAASACVR